MRARTQRTQASKGRRKASKARRTPRLLNTVPPEVLTAHMLPFLNTQNAVRWAQASKAARRSAQPALNARREAREQELETLARVLTTAIETVAGKPDGTLRLQEAIRGLPSGQFTVTGTEVIRTPGVSGLVFNGSVDTAHFRSSVHLAQRIELGPGTMAVTGEVLIIAMWSKRSPGKSVRIEQDTIREPPQPIRITRHGGFSARLAERVRRALE